MNTNFSTIERTAEAAALSRHLAQHDADDARLAEFERLKSLELLNLSFSDALFRIDPEKAESVLEHINRHVFQAIECINKNDPDVVLVLYSARALIEQTREDAAGQIAEQALNAQSLISGVYANA